jgi:hypothetical protein
MKLAMDGSTIEQGDTIHSRDGVWTVISSKSGAATIKGQTGVRREIGPGHVSGDSRQYGWHPPVTFWRGKNEHNWPKFLSLANQMRELTYV